MDEHKKAFLKEKFSQLDKAENNRRLQKASFDKLVANLIEEAKKKREIKILN